MTNEVHAFFNVPDNYLHRKYGVRIRAELVRQLVGDLQRKEILDVGCGDGGVSLQFLANNRIVFCDIAEKMLDLVKEQIPQELRLSADFYHGSVDEFQLDKSFDDIFCIGVLAHVPSVERTISKLAKLLVPGGRLVLQFSDANHWLTRWSIRNASYEYQVNKVVYQDIADCCQKYGLKRSDEVRYHFLVPGMGKLPDRWLYSFQKMTISPSLLSKLGTDYIWVLHKL